MENLKSLSVQRSPEPQEMTFEGRSELLKLTKTLDTNSRTQSMFRSVNPDDCRALLAMKKPSLCTPDEAIFYAEKLVSDMPGTPENAKQWIADAAAIFTHFARRDVQTTVMDPMNGIRASEEWLPVISKLKKFLDALAERRGRILASARFIVKIDEEEKARAELDASMPSKEKMFENYQRLRGELRAKTTCA